MLNGKHVRASILTLLIGSMALVACSTPTPPTTGGTVTVTGVSPASGPVAGGTSITVTGTGFVVGATVNLLHDADVHPASGVAITSSTTLTATVPAHPAGVLGVVVAIPGGASATLANAYTYVQDPSTPVTVTSVTPSSGLVTGGTSVTIAGSGFAVGPTVTFGGTAATGVAVTSTGSLTATVPAHAPGAVDVVVTNPGGPSGTLANGYTFVPEPTQLTKADWQVDFEYLGGNDRLEVQILQSGGTLSGSGRDNNAEVDFVTTGTITANTINVTFTLSNGGSSRGSVTCTGTIDAGPPQTISGSFTSPTNEAVGGTSGSCDFS
jgi:hypothetical protein